MSVREEQEQGFSLRGGEAETEGNHNAGWAITSPGEGPVPPQQRQASRAGWRQKYVLSMA